MKRHITSILAHQFISAGFWMVIAMGILNLGSYLYHLVMVRLLRPPSLVGELESAISLLYIFTVPLTTISLIIVKFVSTYKGRGDSEMLSSFYSYIRQKIIITGVGITVLLFFLSPFLVSLLHLSSLSMGILFSVNFLVGLFSTFGKGVLQGIGSFFAIAVTNLVESVIKVGLGILFVTIGLRTEGAFAALALGTGIAYLVTLFYLRTLPKAKTTFTDKKEVLSYALPVFFMTLALTSLYSSDVILVRYFFPGVESGYYSVLSIMGRIIHFAVIPITLVMFPLVSGQIAKGERFRHIILPSFLLTTIVASVLVLIFFLFPEFMVLLLPGREYLAVVPYVGLFGLFMGLYALCYLLANFYLSLQKTFPIYFVTGAALLQIVGIILFHANLYQVISVSIIVCIVLLLSLLVYLPYSVKQLKEVR